MLSATLEEGLKRLCDRREDSRPAPEEEDGAGRAGAAFRAVARVALETRNRSLVPDAADAAPDRARLQRRPRLFLRQRAREAARGGGPQGGTRAASRASGWEGRVVSLRVARLPRDRAAVQLRTTPSSSPWRATRSGCIRTRARSSSTRSRAGCMFTSTGRSTRSSPVTRCTSTPAFLMDTAAAAPQHAVPSWLRPPDRLPRRATRERSLRKLV